jgi:HEAT repeat protein
MDGVAFKTRAVNWLTNQEAALAELCIQHSDVLNGKVTEKLTSAMKKQKWVNIATRINSLGEHRTAEQCQKKWRNICSKAQQRARAFSKASRQTGK